MDDEGLEAAPVAEANLRERHSMDLKRYGPWALIVGGSEGIGREFARKLGANGFNLALVARKVEPLEELAAEVRACGVEVRTLSADMSNADALERVRSVTDDVEVGLLIYNAGANSTRGAFVELDPVVFRSVININVVGQAEFCRHYGGLMRQRERGGLILMGAMAGFLGSPTLASYCGSKAFGRVFSEALWAECRPFGIDVLHVILGLTATPAMARLGYQLDKAQQPQDVAQEALDNIANGPVLITGENNEETAVKSSRVTNRAEIVGALGLGGRR